MELIMLKEIQFSNSGPGCYDEVPQGTVITSNSSFTTQS